jgi:putative hemolysin
LRESKFWKIGFLLLFAALLAGVAYFAYSYGKGKSALSGNKNNDLTGMANPASAYCIEQSGTVQIVKDNTGNEAGVCLFPDGSECDEWAFYRKECQKGQSKETGVSDSDLIKQAMLKKINSDETKMLVTVSEIDGNYAKGGVSPIGGAGGAYFIAAKVSGNWVIVYDGQAQPYCSQIAPYNFPKAMVPECWDAKGGLVKR